MANICSKTPSTMSMMTLSALQFKNPLNSPSPKLSPLTHHHINPSFRLISSSSKTLNAKPLNKLQSAHSFYGSFKKSFNGFPVKSSGFFVNAQNESGFSSGNMEEEKTEEGRGRSSMPERFRYLTKEAPDKPVWWPLLIVLAFMLYTWRSVLWELSNWRKAIGAIGGLFIYLSKFIIAGIFHFIGDPVTSLIQGFETTLYTIRAFYSSVIAYAPIPELTCIIMLTCTVISIAEAAENGSSSRQPYLLTFAGLIGYAAVGNYISELFFWILLAGMFGFARFVKKRDYVSSALSVCAVLAAVGEPWIRAIVMALFLGLAIFHHSRNKICSEEDVELRKGVPIPLLCAALAIGVRVAAKWAGYRHLTWMIV